jgi:hypothetical protein
MLSPAVLLVIHHLASAGPKVSQKVGKKWCFTFLSKKDEKEIGKIHTTFMKTATVLCAPE